jgi:TrmH family RNA methyltransferase
MGANESSALVLGRESSGLTNTELERCNFLVHIPANPDYSSLNIAAALQVLSYELFVAIGKAPPPPVSPSVDEALASHEELEGYYAHLEQTLHEIDFLDPDNPRQLMRRLRRLYGRAGLKRMELNILRGILTATQKLSSSDRRDS